MKLNHFIHPRKLAHKGDHPVYIKGIGCHSCPELNHTLRHSCHFGKRYLEKRGSSRETTSCSTGHCISNTRPFILRQNTDLFAVWMQLMIILTKMKSLSYVFAVTLNGNAGFLHG